MPSQTTTRLLRRLSFVLFVFSLALFVPYAVKTRSVDAARLLSSGLTTLPSSGLILSSACAFLSLFVLLGESDTSSRGTTILIAHLDLLLSLGLLVNAVLLYDWIGRVEWDFPIWHSRDMLILMTHSIMVLLVQSLSQLTLAVSTLLPIVLLALSSLRNRTYHDDPEVGGESVGRIALPTSPSTPRPDGDSFTLSTRAKAFRFCTVIIALLYILTQMVWSHLHVVLTVFPLFASASLCLIMTANNVLRSHASKPAVYWAAVAEDLAIGATNIAIPILFLNLFPLRSFPGQLIVGMAHIGFALKAITDWLDGRTTPNKMGFHDQPAVMSAAGGASPGSASHTETRDEAQPLLPGKQRLVVA